MGTDTTEDRIDVTSRDGTTIACFRSGSGPSLVLVHGTLGSHVRWQPLLPKLDEHFTTFAVDRRGRGESGDTEPYAIEREFEDIAVVVDAVPGPVDLFGHSYGALVAMEAALLTGSVRRLVLYEPAIPTEGPDYPEGALEELEKIYGSQGAEAVLEAFLTNVVRMPPEELDLMRASPAWPARVQAVPTLVREGRAEVAYRWDAQRFAELTVPTQVMMGSLSPQYLTHSARTARMAIPHATLAVLDGQQHVAMDTAPDLFLTTLLDFLKG